MEVAEKLGKLNANGSTLSAVNFPEVSLPPHLGAYRELHIHRSQPGGMASVNAIFSESGINIAGEYLQTDEPIGYVVVDLDVDEGFDAQRLDRLKAVEGTLRARIVSRYWPNPPTENLRVIDQRDEGLGFDHPGSANCLEFRAKSALPEVRIGCGSTRGPVGFLYRSGHDFICPAP